MSPNVVLVIVANSVDHDGIWNLTVCLSEFPVYKWLMRNIWCGDSIWLFLSYIIMTSCLYSMCEAKRPVSCNFGSIIQKLVIVTICKDQMHSLYVTQSDT